MSTLYEDLSLTAFPGDLDSFTTFLNITSSDGPLIYQYQQALQQGNTTQANQILAQIPSASQKIIKAMIKAGVPLEYLSIYDIAYKGILKLLR